MLPLLVAKFHFRVVSRPTDLNEWRGVAGVKKIT
jgi:hypothetical protein